MYQVPRLVDMFVANHMLPTLEENARRNFSKAYTSAPPRIPGGAPRSPPQGAVLPMTREQAQAAERRELAAAGKSLRGSVGSRRPGDVRRSTSNEGPAYGPPNR